MRKPRRQEKGLTTKDKGDIPVFAVCDVPFSVFLIAVRRFLVAVRRLLIISFLSVAGMASS